MPLLLCHDQPCAKGETNIVATIFDIDEATAQSICDRFNAHPNPARYLTLIKEVFEL